MVGEATAAASLAPISATPLPSTMVAPLAAESVRLMRSSASTAAVVVQVDGDGLHRLAGREHQRAAGGGVVHADGGGAAAGGVVHGHRVPLADWPGVAPSITVKVAVPAFSSTMASLTVSPGTSTTLSLSTTPISALALAMVALVAPLRLK